MLKCAQYILDLFSTENLSLHHKRLISLIDQFDLHKLLQLFYEKKNCTLQLVFLPMFLGEDWTNSFFADWEGKKSYRHFQSNGVDNPCVD